MVVETTDITAEVGRIDKSGSFLYLRALLIP
jgi:hypothetical protein